MTHCMDTSAAFIMVERVGLGKGCRPEQKRWPRQLSNCWLARVRVRTPGEQSFTYDDLMYL